MTTNAVPDGEIIAFKGFDANLQCRGFQFEIGKTYEHAGPVKACSGGFHACEYPLDVFSYYGPVKHRFAVVRQSGALDRERSDTKVASGRITIEAEIGIPEIVKRAVEWVFARSKPEGETATGYRGASSATGYRGASSATGYGGASSATGYGGASSATGLGGAAMSIGTDGRVMGAAGCALFLVHRSRKTGKVIHAWAGIAGKGGIKPGVWYRLDSRGKPVRVEA